MPNPYTNLPKPLAREDYESLAAAAARTLSVLPGVRAVYLLGDTWMPGVSDMDLLVVCDDGRDTALPGPWSLSKEASFIFTHRYLAMGRGAARKLLYLFPEETTSLRRLAGDDIGFERPKEALAADEYRDLLACVFFDVLVTKLLPLAGELSLRGHGGTDVRARIGALYSLRYSERLLGLVCGYAMPEALRGQIESLRAQWFERGEAQSLALMEEVSRECAAEIFAMAAAFAEHSAARYPGAPAGRFFNGRYACTFVDGWNKEAFLESFARKRLRLRAFGRTLAHDTLVLPRPLSAYFAQYASAQGVLGEKMRGAFSGAPAEPQGGIAAHIGALEAAFEDYAQSRGGHKIPYAFGFAPRAEPRLRLLLTRLCLSIK